MRLLRPQRAHSLPAMSAIQDHNPAAQATPEAPETPSGKGAGDENFPVGSFLLPRRLRPHVAKYYAFARAIDDIADNPELPADDRIVRLEAFAAALNGAPGYGAGYEKALALRDSMAETGVPTKHGSDLTIAFVQDARKNRYATWEDLVGYCEYSANPVGRYLLDLHGEDPSGYRYSDALCTVLQVLNHMQDCAEDLRDLDRCYIPQAWMAEAGASVDDVRGERLTPGLRVVLDRMLARCDELMVDARRLPAALKSRRLAMESAVIVRLAGRLAVKLKRGDPLAERVALTKPDFAAAGVGGMISGFLAAGRGA